MKKFLVGALLVVIPAISFGFEQHPDGSVTLTKEEVAILQNNIGEMVRINQAAVQYIEQLEKALAEEKSKKCLW